MLSIFVPKIELFDESKDRFVTIQSQTLLLEHSLLSISKWESKWMKPFLDDKNKKTNEEVIDYIRCMSTRPIKREVLNALTIEDINSIVEYIDSPMTASSVTIIGNDKPRRETITSELIYYWMINAGVPFECEKWHLNRLLMLLKIFGAKNQTHKKINAKESARIQSDLNAQRRRMLKSKG